MKIEIKTQHLVMRPYQPIDFENSVQLYGNTKAMKYFDYGQPLSRESVKALTEKGCALFKKGQPFGLFSILHQETMDFVGHIDSFPLEDNSAIVEMGIILS